MSYIGQSSSLSTRSQTSATATSGQTTFTVSYTPGAIDVYRNGIRLQDGVDYTATNGTTVILTTGAVAGDALDFVKYSATGLSNVYSQTEADGIFAAKTSVEKYNYVINGNFAIWQRGASFTNPGNGSFTADRWIVGFDGTGGARTIQAVSLGVSDEQAPWYFQWVQTTNETGNTYRQIVQRLEDVRTLSGKTVTLSFTHNCANTVSGLDVFFAQNFGSGGTPSSSVSTTAQTYTTQPAAVRTTMTFNVPSLVGKTLGTNNDHYLALVIKLPANQTFGWWNIWNVKLEIGSEATPFQHRPYAEELALCQRYFQRWQQPPLRGVMGTTTIPLRLGMSIPTMRKAPGVTMNGNLPIYDGSTTSTISSITTIYVTASTVELDATCAAALATGRPAIVYQSGTSSLDLNAEL